MKNHIGIILNDSLPVATLSPCVITPVMVVSFQQFPPSVMTLEMSARRLWYGWSETLNVMNEARTWEYLSRSKVFLYLKKVLLVFMTMVLLGVPWRLICYRYGGHILCWKNTC